MVVMVMVVGRDEWLVVGGLREGSVRGEARE